jgi:hypothetical protein
MPDLRKLRAALQLAIVSALFWGTAAALAGIGVRVIANGLSISANFGLALRLFVIGAPLGFVGGLFFAAGIALVAPGEESRGLSGRRVAMLGAVGGLLVFAVLRLAFFGDVAAWSMATTFVPAAVFGLLGAATGLGILGSANRARLQREVTPPRSLAP